MFNPSELTDAEIDAVLREKRLRKLAPQLKAQRRRAHLKRTYFGRYKHRIDEAIIQCSLKLELLREIKAEL